MMSFIRPALKRDDPSFHDVNHASCPPNLEGRLNRRESCDAIAPSCEGGGARRVRTDDLMLAKHALYQLSYGPSRERGSVGSDLVAQW